MAPAPLVLKVSSAHVAPAELSKRAEVRRPDTFVALLRAIALTLTITVVCGCSTAIEPSPPPAVKLVVERTVDPEFTPVWSSAGLRILQYARMVWAGTGGGIAASVLQGPYAVVVDDDHRRAHPVDVSPRGSALTMAWLSGSSNPLAEGMGFGADGKPTAAWFQLRPNGASVLGDAQRRPQSVAARGVVLPDGSVGFVAIEATGIVGVDSAPPLVVRDAGGVEKMHFDPFPNDGARRLVVDADFQQAGDRIVMLSALFRVTRPGGKDPAGAWVEPISGNDIEVVDVVAKRPLCRLTFDDERINGFWHSFNFNGVAVSPDTKRFVVNTPKGAILYDLDACRQLFTLNDDRDQVGASGKWIAFSGDGRYVIRDGMDVRSPEGGTLDVWRTSDGRHVIHEETAVHNALAIKPNSAEFAAGRDDGQITFFRIESDR